MGIEDSLKTLLQDTDKATAVDLTYWSSYKGCYQVAFQDVQTDTVYVLAIEEGLTNNPFVGTITFPSIAKQCEEQGIASNASVIQIWKRVKNCVLQETLDSFDVSESQFKISVTVTDILKVFFTIPCIKVKDCQLVSIIMGSLVKYVSTTAQRCMEETRKVICIIKEKDKNIEYLKVLVKDLGGGQILEKHAPVGSVNHAVLKPFDEVHLRDQIVADMPNDNQGFHTKDIFEVGKTYINANRTPIHDQLDNQVLPKESDIVIPGIGSTLRHYQDSKLQGHFKHSINSDDQSDNLASIGKHLVVSNCDENSNSAKVIGPIIKTNKKRKFGRVKTGKPS
ncbi:similar to Vanderwaltozyma polyspora Kpol_1042p5 hypothetical protein [Maudiozyma saulgeensis]|uniref:Uncharacterized protein n=1 Tax=Maudiozyma saulgeensis TaxID=1789683 RepID=A0A1X7QZT0_9SACH|nr:similar to Vanderwaltozyma polyspora Kpol_1042p5 hypothetical protein [Kazachstania saulgeensis]